LAFRWARTASATASIMIGASYLPKMEQKALARRNTSKRQAKQDIVLDELPDVTSPQRHFHTNAAIIPALRCSPMWQCSIHRPGFDMSTISRPSPRRNDGRVPSTQILARHTIARQHEEPLACR